MIKKIFTLLCLCTLCIGSAWGTIANPYSFTFVKNDLTTSSTSYTSGDVTWSLSATENSWNGTANQTGYVFGTADATKTLTISTEDILGTITQISVTGRSHKKSKTAVVSVKVGETTFTTTDDTWDNGDNQTLTFIGSASGKIAVTITPDGCGYVLNGISVTYTESTDPSISAGNVELAADATSGEIAYTITNPVDGKSLTTSSTTDWISNIQVTSDKVTFNTTENTGTESRVGTITLIYEGATDKNVTVTQNKPIPVYASLADLVAAEIESGTIVKVSFENAEITGLYTNAQGKRYGVYLNTKKDDKNIEIYCTKAEHSDTWELHGTLSGTLEGAWKEYEGTWEICPDSWDDLTYTAPSKPNPTIAADCNSLLKVGESDEYTVTYSGDGTLSITSSKTDVAEATISGKAVSITAKAAGTTTIKISAPETDNYYAVEETYTLTVIAPASLPFAFDGGKSDVETTAGMSQTGLGSDYGSSPKLKFDDTNDNIVIWFNCQADYVSYDIKGNVSSGSWSGTFDVMESADGEQYTSVASYTALGSTKETETNALKSDTRYVKFVYTNKSSGNVGLGNIKIGETYPVTISDAKYATLGLPYAATIPTGVSAYTATVEGATVTMTKISGTTIPANCGVILYAAAGDYTFEPVANVNPISDNKLVAVVSGPYTCTGEDVGKVYYLGKDGDKATFKKLTEGGTIAAGKAYLKLDEAISAAKLDVTFGEPTGIESLTPALSEGNEVYNLNGMRVNPSTGSGQAYKAYKGIVITNGKKLIVR